MKDEKLAAKIRGVYALAAQTGLSIKDLSVLYNHGAGKNLNIFAAFCNILVYASRDMGHVFHIIPDQMPAVLSREFIINFTNRHHGVLANLDLHATAMSICPAGFLCPCSPNALDTSASWSSVSDQCFFKDFRGMGTFPRTVGMRWKHPVFGESFTLGHGIADMLAFAENGLSQYIKERLVYQRKYTYNHNAETLWGNKTQIFCYLKESNAYSSFQQKQSNPFQNTEIHLLNDLYDSNQAFLKLQSGIRNHNFDKILSTNNISEITKLQTNANTLPSIQKIVQDDYYSQVDEATAEDYITSNLGTNKPDWEGTNSKEFLYQTREKNLFRNAMKTFVGYKTEHCNKIALGVPWSYTFCIPPGDIDFNISNGLGVSTNQFVWQHFYFSEVGIIMEHMKGFGDDNGDYVWLPRIFSIGDVVSWKPLPHVDIKINAYRDWNNSLYKENEHASRSKLTASSGKELTNLLDYDAKNKAYIFNALFERGVRDNDAVQLLNLLKSENETL